MSDKNNEKLTHARKISALKGHLTRLMNMIQNCLNSDKVESEEIMELQEWMCDKRDVIIDSIYDLISNDEGEAEVLKDRKISFEIRS